MIAIYARYSSDLQNDRSIEDQVMTCRDIIQKNSLSGITHIYADRAISGTDASRPNLIRLMDDIDAKKIKTVVTESIDRISRDQEDIARFYKLAEYQNVPILSAHEGLISKIHIGLNGTMSALQLEQIANRTRRGQAGNIRQGKSSGGLAYGYRKRILNEDGMPEAGLREINLEEAKIVRQIYRRYLEGASISAIRNELNHARVPSPRGGLWTTVTIGGHNGRHNGILQNPIYKGLLVWNRNNFDKHPQTGVRHVRSNKESEWVTNFVKELQIISEEDWEKAQQKRAEGRRKNKERKRYKKYPIKVTCGACEKVLIYHNAEYLVCSTAAQYGTCKNTKKVNIKKLENQLQHQIQQNFQWHFDQWMEQLSRAQKKTNQDRSKIMKEIEIKRRKLDYIINDLWNTMSDNSPLLHEKILKEEKKLENLTNILNQIAELPSREQFDFERIQSKLFKKNNLVLCIHSITLQNYLERLKITEIKPHWSKLSAL